MLGCPAEHLDFHIWYLKEKGWIRRTENGTLEITVAGVDQINTEYNQPKVATEELQIEQRHDG